MNLLKKCFVLSILVLALFSCKKEDEGIPQKGSVEFTINVNTAEKSTSVSATPSAVVVSVDDQQGNTIYKNELISLTSVNDNYKTNTLYLEPGVYKLTKFMVVDADGNVLNVTPMGFSSGTSLVENPLPISFNIQLGVKTMLDPQIISTQSRNPQDLGYTSFKLNEQGSINFQLGVYTFNAGSNQFEPAAAHLSVITDAGETLENDLNPSLNAIAVKEANKYILTVSKDGYQSWADTLTLNDLLHFYTTPMAVTLDKTSESSINFVTVQDTLSRVTINLNSSDNNTPLRVNWGDGHIEVYNSATKLTHDFSVTGNYRVRITGNMEAMNKLGLTHCAIGSVNLDKAVNLTSIEISRNQNLKALNLSGKLHLKEIYCVEGALESLNLTNSDSIVSIYCSLNDLTSLDLSTLPVLKTLYCDRNKLSVLDTKYNPNLQVLYCYQNNLSSLDISSNVNLLTLDCRNINFSNSSANKILVDLLQTVKANPRSGQINLSVSVTGDGQTAKDSLEKAYQWTVSAM
ncbi:MAG TPA: hypothetical protein VIH57_16025 [Bacteroidales bacterium]